MNKILYLFFFTIAFTFSGKASDRPEDVIRKAERDFAKQDVAYPHLTQACRDLFANNKAAHTEVRHLPRKSLELQETMTNLSNKLGCPVMTSQELRTQREDRNDQLMHALNAGISLLSDYLLQFQNDDDLTWTFETYPLYAGPTGTELIPLDGVQMIEENINGAYCRDLPTVYLYEILRQKSCIDLSTLLGLMRFWKKTIFPDSTFRSYCNIDALALKMQVGQRMMELKKRIEQPKNQDLWKLDLERSISLVLEDLLTKFPEKEMSFVNGLKVPKNFDFKVDRKFKIINQKKEKYDEFYIELIISTAKLTSELNSLIMDPLKQYVQPNYTRDFKITYNTYLNSLIYHSSEKKKNILDFEKLFLQIQHLNFQENEEPSEEIPPEEVFVAPVNDALIQKSFSLIIELDSLCLFQRQDIYNNLFMWLDNRSLSCLASTNKFLHKNFSEALSKRLEAQNLKENLLYSEDYWKTENLLHQQRKHLKGENVSSIQEPSLTDYEINLFNFLKENIFKINCHLKVSKLKSDLSSLFFDVVINKNGKGSLHYVSSGARNPLFGNNTDYQGAYFNVHLPHSNEVIPPGYFRYLQSGFENIFGLSSNSIDTCLRSVKPK